MNTPRIEKLFKNPLGTEKCSGMPDRKNDQRYFTANTKRQ